ncbi:hypothetical protein [Pseudomonas pohangensis]|uniref:hypothetical protein n=1 Tax=Pseudomonas pohangensis TaxID=364197 RepID=UPI0012FD6432|nr:hypothetical protein [Pseudomonas pohangensis]
MRIRYWYERLRQRTHLNTAYQLEQLFEPDSFVHNSDGTIQYYKNKWIGYEQGRHLPQEALLKKVERKLSGSTRDLNHPLWKSLDIANKRVMRDDAFLRELAPVVQNLLYQPAFDGMQSFEVRAPVTKSLLEKLERRASMDVLACLVWLLRESAAKQSKDSEMIGHALHNVLIIMTLEFESLKIGLPLLRLFIDHILPLGVPAHHRMWMIPTDYLHASVNLNLLASRRSKRWQDSVAWSNRIKIMQRLLKGRLGTDVLYAMRPQYQLDETNGEIPTEVIENYKRTCNLREWGWENIWSITPESFPPLKLLLREER